MSSIMNYLQSTMLIERLVGVGVYALALGYFYSKIRHSKSKRAIKRYINQYLTVLCIMAFFYIPGEAADLYRWRNLAEPWKETSFSWFWNNRVITSNTPLGYLLIYACQMTGVDGVLPMACAFGFFGNVFHIIKCESLRDNRRPDSIAVALLFVMSSGRYLEVISGIRCMLAFSIVFRFMYDEMYEGKSMLRSVPFYVFSVLLHNAAIPLIGIRMFCSLFEKKRSIVNNILNGLMTVALLIVGIIVGDDYIDAGFAKANSYMSSNVYSYGWEYVIVILSMTIIVVSMWKFMKRYPNVFKCEIKSERYLLILLAGEILTLGTYSIFHRFAAVSIVMSVPMLLSFLNCEYDNFRGKSKRRIVIMSIFILFLACVRGNLCGYKFFLLS